MLSVRDHLSAFQANGAIIKQVADIATRHRRSLGGARIRPSHPKIGRNGWQVPRRPSRPYKPCSRFAVVEARSGRQRLTFRPTEPSPGHKVRLRRRSQTAPCACKVPWPRMLGGRTRPPADGEPNRALGGNRSVRSTHTELGARSVEDVLLRIAYGVYSYARMEGFRPALPGNSLHCVGWPLRFGRGTINEQRWSTPQVPAPWRHSNIRQPGPRRVARRVADGASHGS